MKERRNLYHHSVDLSTLTLKNLASKEFKQKLEDIPYRGYEVEQLADGRKIVITKPGGKRVWGKPKREDFLVWVYNPIDTSLWLISHKDIYADLLKKAATDKAGTLRILMGLRRVYSGEDPDKVLASLKLSSRIGENPEVLLKSYKWIWGQEDVNYPSGLGRRMSFEGLRMEEGKEVRTGTGLTDLELSLKKSISKKKKHSKKRV